MPNEGKRKKNLTLSLCMIVKNEEEFLGRCLDSVKDAVDEMVIVDTGSDDQTVEIAESYGARVYHHSWQGSFSEARNYGLQFAKEDWILQMDADEEFEKEDIPILKKVLQSNLYNTINVAILSDTSDGWGKHYFQRIFRRGKACYEGIVHNQLKSEGACLNSEIRIYHWGYNLSKEKMEAKFKRTETLLLKQISEDETNPFAHHNYLRVLRARERYEDAVVEGRKALLICKDRMKENHRQMIVYDTAHCMMVVGCYKEAEKLCIDVLEDHPQNLDLLFTLGSILMNQKRHSEAIETFQQFLSTLKQEKNQPKYNQLIVDTYNFDHKAWEFISGCYYELEEFKKAKNAILRAISLRPENILYQVALAQTLLKLGEQEQALEILKRVERNGHTKPDFYIRWAALCKEQPEIGEPIEIIRKGLEKFPQNDELHNNLAYTIYKHDFETAEKEWFKALEINQNHIGANMGLARLYAENVKLQDLERRTEIIFNQSNNRDVLKMVGGYCLHAKCYSKAIDLFSKYLTMDPENVEVLSDVATCYAKLGQYEAALIGYREAVKLGSQNPVIIKNIKALQRLMSN